MKIRVSLAALAVAATSSSLALAQGQPWLQDRAYGEGIGIRVGDLELHPGIAGEFGYDSNYFQRAHDEEPIIDTFRLRITPSFSVATLGARRRQLTVGQAQAAPVLNFRAGVYAAYNEFIAADSEFQDAMSDQRHLDAGANLQLDILPQRPVGADIYGDFVRAIEPSNNPDTSVAWDRDSLRLGAGATWRPGGGLFDWRFGYEFRYNYFEQEAFRYLNNTHHYLNTRGRFRFLPRTALLYDAQYGFIRYSNTTTQSDGDIIQARVGINGLITTRFAALALVGWTESFYEATGLNGAEQTRNYDSITAQAELKWFLLPQPQLQPGDATVGLSSIAVGYIRDFNNSYLGDYFSRDRVYADFAYFIGGRVILDLQGGYSRIGHPDIGFPDPVADVPAFSENRVDVQLFAEYRASDVVGINTTIRYDASLGDNRVGADNLQFNRWQAYLGARLFW